MAPTMRAAVLSIVLANLVACGGGGGGGGGVVVPSEVAFTSFGAIAPNQTVVMDAIAITANVSGTTDAGGNVTLNSVNFTPEGAGTVRLSYDGSRALSGINISTPQPNSSVSFNRNTPGHSIGCSGGICSAGSPTASAVAVDAFAVGWNYQSFGVWGIDTSPSTAVFGVLSAGSPTSGNALPTSGPATFNGLAAGFFVDSGGAPFATAATMNASVDFGTRHIAFSTSNTSTVNVNTGIRNNNVVGLNLTGDLSYAQGVNAFSGTLNTQNGQLTGQGSGRFYGPAAQEIGGVYSLSGSGGSMIGGFGGKR